jgi:hypothetical protein
MKKFFKNLFDETIASLHNRPGGFSARKLTAGVTMLLVIYLHFKHVDASNVVSVLVYDMLFILLLLSIITIDQLYKFKLGANKAEEAKQETPSEPKKTTTVEPKPSNNTNQNVG